MRDSFPRLFIQFYSTSSSWNTIVTKPTMLTKSIDVRVIDVYSGIKRTFTMSGNQQKTWFLKDGSLDLKRNPLSNLKIIGE